MHVQIVCVLRSFHQATHRQGNSRFTQNQKCFGQIGMSQNWWNCYRLPSDLISLVFSFYGLSVSIVMFVSATTKFTIPISHHAIPANGRQRHRHTGPQWFDWKDLLNSIRIILQNFVSCPSNSTEQQFNLVYDHLTCGIIEMETIAERTMRTPWIEMVNLQVYKLICDSELRWPDQWEAIQIFWCYSILW